MPRGDTVWFSDPLKSTKQQKKKKKRQAFKPGPVGMTSASSWIEMEEQSHSPSQGKLAPLLSLDPSAENSPWSSSWSAPKQILPFPEGAQGLCRRPRQDQHVAFLVLIFTGKKWQMTSTYYVFSLFTRTTSRDFISLLKPNFTFFNWYSKYLSVPPGSSAFL